MPHVDLQTLLLSLPGARFEQFFELDCYHILRSNERYREEDYPEGYLSGVIRRGRAAIANALELVLSGQLNLAFIQEVGCGSDPQLKEPSNHDWGSSVAQLCDHSCQTCFKILSSVGFS